MGVSTTEQRRETLRSDGEKAFWAFANRHYALRESERLIQIKKGFPVQLFQAMRLTFNLQQEMVAILFNGSASTFERRIREDQALDTVASERLDRIASVSNLAHGVFENQDAAAKWMSVPNKALGDIAPILLCETEIGAKQVRRVLHALEWGGAA
jgi:putative toxin-antitoxin system antitoxin component (TIGR02293 family)